MDTKKANPSPIDNKRTKNSKRFKEKEVPPSSLKTKQIWVPRKIIQAQNNQKSIWVPIKKLPKPERLQRTKQIWQPKATRVVPEKIEAFAILPLKKRLKQCIQNSVDME